MGFFQTFARPSGSQGSRILRRPPQNIATQNSKKRTYFRATLLGEKCSKTVLAGSLNATNICKNSPQKRCGKIPVTKLKENLMFAPCEHQKTMFFMGGVIKIMTSRIPAWITKVNSNSSFFKAILPPESLNLLCDGTQENNLQNHMRQTPEKSQNVVKIQPKS